MYRHSNFQALENILINNDLLAGTGNESVGVDYTDDNSVVKKSNRQLIKKRKTST